MIEANTSFVEINLARPAVNENYEIDGQLITLTIPHINYYITGRGNYYFKTFAGTFNVTFDNVDSYMIQNFPNFQVGNNAHVELNLIGDKLTIAATSSKQTSSSYGPAGIGGNSGESNGSITINGRVIHVTGLISDQIYSGSGIGEGTKVTAKEVTKTRSANNKVFNLPAGYTAFAYQGTGEPTNFEHTYTLNNSLYTLRIAEVEHDLFPYGDSEVNTEDTVHAVLLDIMISEPPVFDYIYEGDTTVRGDVIEGSLVVITFPYGSEVETTVDENGRWTVEVPEGIYLEKKDKLKGVKT